MKTKTTLLTLMLCASGALAQMTPPGATNSSGTYTPQSPPTEGYTFKGVPAPNGELPWFRALQPAANYDGTNLNHLAALGSHLADWTNEQAISPDNVLLFKYPKSVTNQTVAWRAGTIHHWWVATNGSTEIVVSNALDVYIQPHDDWFAGTLTSSRFQGTYQDPNTNFVPDLIWKRFYGTVRNDSAIDIPEQIRCNLDATNMVVPVIPQGATTNFSFYLGRPGYGDTNVLVEWICTSNATTLADLDWTIDLPERSGFAGSGSVFYGGGTNVIIGTDPLLGPNYTEFDALVFNPYTNDIDAIINIYDQSTVVGVNTRYAWIIPLSTGVSSYGKTNGETIHLQPGGSVLVYAVWSNYGYAQYNFTLSQLNHTNALPWQTLLAKSVSWIPPLSGLEVAPANVGDWVWDGTQLKGNYSILTNSYPMDMSLATQHMMMTNDATIWPAVTSYEHTGPGLYLLGHPGDTWTPQTTPALGESWTTLTNSATLNLQGEGGITLPSTGTNQMQFYRLKQ